LRAAFDTAARGFMRAPVIVALPVIVYWSLLPGVSWAGWPAPSGLIPDIRALLGFGTFFGYGWLLQGQQDWLATFVRRWGLWACAALALWLVCRLLGAAAGTGGAHLVYTACYVLGAWCASLCLLGASIRWLSGYSPARRYLADASYWIYLMHIPGLLFFQQLLHPLHWSWMLKYPLSIAASLLILLTTYHRLVRFTFMGAILNGHRRLVVRRSAVAEQLGERCTQRGRSLPAPAGDDLQSDV
jgi:peptidoglycan/LPS O-acetylase OafA/YrhL